MKVYLNESPRTFILTSNSVALIIRHPQPSSSHSHHHIHRRLIDNRAIVEFINIDNVDLSKYLDLTVDHELLGFLGFFNIKNNIFLMFISESTKVATPRMGEDIHQIVNTKVFCLNSDNFDNKSELLNEMPTHSTTKFLCNGAFYYSTQFDITSNLQERPGNTSDFNILSDLPHFSRFMWNSYLVNELIEFRKHLTPSEAVSFDKSGFLTIITRGYAKTVNITLDNKDALLTIISKQSCMKNGPIFGEWGCDDKGSVSNYHETEIIIYTDRFCFSYLIVKGNVPIFWEIENSNFKTRSKLLSSSGGKKITFPRSFESSQNGFARHIDRLYSHFGDICILKSFPTDGNVKLVLGEHLDQHIKEYNKTAVTNLQEVDLHLKSSMIKKFGYSIVNPYNLVHVLADQIVEFGATFYDIESNDFIGKQMGVFRITTYDSLSKANFISKVISQEVIELAFRDLNIEVGSEILIKHAKLWKDCDEATNKNVLGFVSYSDKLQSSSATSTKKKLKSKVSKKYLSNVVDSKVNETALLKLLGRLHDQEPVTLLNPIHNYINQELQKRSKLYVSSKNIIVFSSTFNINGKCHDGDISDWLFPKKIDNHDYDLVLIGLQEVIELSPSKIVNVDSENKKFWERKIKQTLNQNNTHNNTYSSLWTGQLGGLGLFIFIKHSEIKKISDVESSFKKTGFRGVTANKGGIAVRFSYDNTQLCFVTSHLAAGLSNADERHYDYKVIAKGMKFSRNRKIKDHDAVIWLGDLNFRIDLTLEQAKNLIETQQFAKLFEYDQLNKQMTAGESFPFFDEMEIKFPPTYKFDNGTTTYDTSEKQRIPAWTDRILSLSRNKVIKQLEYFSCDSLIFSDHRPVWSIFQVKIDIENETIKANLNKEIYNNYKEKFGEITDFITNNLNYINDSLPPPSLERKWWLDGLPARISINELNKGYVVNPRYPKNPFELTSEPEFIKDIRI